MDPFFRPGTSSSLGTGSGGTGGGSDHNDTSYELENAVAEIFRIFQVEESHSFSADSVSEHLAKRIGRQSKKPFSVFFNRLVGYEEFVQKYEYIKYQNINEVDPFVRLLVRIREDKKTHERLNNFYTDLVNHLYEQPVPRPVYHHPHHVVYQTPQTPPRLSSGHHSQRQYHHQQQQPQQQQPLPFHLQPQHQFQQYLEPSEFEPFESESVEHFPVQQAAPQVITTRSRKHHSKPRPQSVITLAQQQDYLPQPQIVPQTNHLLQGSSSSRSRSRHRSRSPNHQSSHRSHHFKSSHNNLSLYQHNPSAFSGVPNNLPQQQELSPLAHMLRVGGSSGGGGSRHEMDYDLEVENTTESMGGMSFQPQTATSRSTVPSHQANSPNPTSSSNKRLPAYLSRDFHPCDWPKENDCFGHLGDVANVNHQEQLLLRDLLYILIGIEGKFIRLQKSDSSRYKLTLDATADRHLVVTTNQILRISYCYSSIVTYVESKVYGLVNQALVAAVQRHLLDYNMLVAQMEELMLKNELFLQKMFYMLLPYITTFQLLRDLATKLYRNKCIGGGVLTVLHEKTKSIQGMDNKALELVLMLTKSASMPYFDILKTWIYYGEISDPRREFFIEDTQHSSSNSLGASPGAAGSAGDHGRQGGRVKGGGRGKSNGNASNNNIIESDDEYDDDFGKFNDKYWDLRYRINSSKTPIFLKKYEQMIYKTGKYVSIINKVKALFVKSSRVPPPSLLNDQHQRHVHHHAAKMEMNSMSSKYSLNDLLRGVASMQMTGNPSLPDVGGAASFMSSNSSSSSNSQLSGASSSGPVIFTPKPEEIAYSFDESTYGHPITAAYEEASSQLLHILINESQLVETFNAVKHYLLLSMGDFIVHFMKFASKDLGKRTDSVVQHRLDSMMGMALGISVAAGDRSLLKDDPHVEFTGKSFLKQIIKIMKPLDSMDVTGDYPSPNSSYLLKTEFDDDDDDDEEEDGDGVGLNRSIISDVIEGKATGFDDERWLASSSGNFLPGMSISSQVRLRKLYINSGKTIKISDLIDSQAGGNRSNGDPSKPNSGLGHLGSPNGVAANKNKLYCYESLMLKFDVPFPLSLIFTQKSIVCYQLMFRYVFLCRYAEMELEETWKDNVLNVQLRHCDQLARNAVQGGLEPENSAETVRSLVKAFKSMHKKAFALRYKMIAFVRNFHYFYAFEVIDPFFAQFISQLTKRGSSLDSVIECHEKFLEHCFSSCFLTSLEITSIIIKIFMLCIELSHALKDSIDPDDHTSMMESSCFFGRPQAGTSATTHNPYSTMDSKSRDSLNNDAPDSKSRSSPSFDSQLHEKLNKIYFSNRHFGKSVSTVREIVEKANAEFDSLVTKLLKKIYSDNCEYHMMYPFVARLDFNDFYRSKIIE